MTDELEEIEEEQPATFTEAEAQVTETPEPIQPPVYEPVPEPTPEPVSVPVPKPVPVYEPPPMQIPAPVPMPEEEEEEEDELDDLFEVPEQSDNDMRTDHLVGIDEPEDLSDLVEVSEEDIMGEDYPGVPPATGEIPNRQRPQSSKYKRTSRRFPPPPTSLGGVRY